MKLIRNKAGRNAGVAMTEYLILLALVAIASLVMTIAFGKQIKTIYKASIDRLNGGTGTDTTGTAPAVINSHMGNFADGK